MYTDLYDLKSIFSSSQYYTEIRWVHNRKVNKNICLVVFGYKQKENNNLCTRKASFLRNQKLFVQAQVGDDWLVMNNFHPMDYGGGWRNIFGHKFDSQLALNHTQRFVLSKLIWSNWVIVIEFCLAARKFEERHRAIDSLKLEANEMKVEATEFVCVCVCVGVVG